MNKLLFTLALRNLLGAGKRTWLNVSVLSFAFVVIIFYNGMLDGWNRQALRDSEQWSIAKGQLWHPAYDPYDANSLADAHASIPDTLRALCRAGIISPQLIVQGAIFPQGRMLNVQLRGIDPNQKVLLIPAGSLLRQSDAVPAVIGKRMARLSNLKAGDRALIQWRDVHGTFDAREIVITSIFSANVHAIDNGYIWLNISTLQQLTGLAGQATLFTISSSDAAASTANWNYRPAEYLMSDLNEIINAKRSGSALIYGLLHVLALLAIFDTQVLSVFRRKKEIGTYMALGMTRGQVIGIFYCRRQRP